MRPARRIELPKPMAEPVSAEDREGIGVHLRADQPVHARLAVAGPTRRREPAKGSRSAQRPLARQRNRACLLIGNWLLAMLLVPVAAQIIRVWALPRHKSLSAKPRISKAALCAARASC